MPETTAPDDLHAALLARFADLVESGRVRVVALGTPRSMGLSVSQLCGQFGLREANRIVVLIGEHK